MTRTGLTAGAHLAAMVALAFSQEHRPMVVTLRDTEPVDPSKPTRYEPPSSAYRTPKQRDDEALAAAEAKRARRRAKRAAIFARNQR